MQPLQCVLQHHVSNPHLSTHMAKQHNHIHAAIPLQICNQRFSNRIELRTYDAPVMAEHRGGTNTHQNARSCTRRTHCCTHEVPFITGSHLTLKNARFGAETTPQNQAPATSNALCNITSQTRISRRTWQNNIITFMQPFHCSLQPKDSATA